ncbi:MAG: hypothetical protein JXB50_01175 [Spirochaetes bacterium]|nr:hypothetical protein [Spirochaetota bacterium]
MKIIDIDNIQPIDSHVHYIKSYKGRAVLMDLKSKIFRYEIEFSIEHNPIEPPKIKVNFKEHPHFPVLTLITKIKHKICEMDEKGIFATLC